MFQEFILWPAEIFYFHETQNDQTIVTTGGTSKTKMKKTELSVDVVHPHNLGRQTLLLPCIVTRVNKTGIEV